MKISFLGDSITYGYGENLNRDDVWTSIIAKSLTNTTLINKGISGDTTGGMLARFHSDIVNDKPDVVHIMGGLNDIGFGVNVEQVRANIKAVCHQADFYGIKPIIGFCPLPIIEQVDKNKVDFMNFDKIIVDMRKLFQWFIDMNSIASTQVKIINYDEELTYRYANNRKNFYLDGIHLNETGNRAIAEIFLDHINNIK
ncbi:Esterase TesA precursor [Phocoenobacter uteri]|uniref:Esterase TesA n=1 Tax=Phocoenobacter uteri TaxID=146806 RepID=A0A379CCR0_9PAST|nr:GDSL-type esterase/lipase family protein [Phocoenobacter uteri]MDG6881516.1 hypothetical protein [Phocoenobacter uteri]SUB59546.1 Esterase TesA precursor [Phocoenobacter uteri]